MGIKQIALNRKALFDYEVIDKHEAGIALLGTEVKSIRDARVNLKDSFARFVGDELWLFNMHISPYTFGNIHNHKVDRTRKLLLHKREMKKLNGKIKEKGLTLIPTKIYIKKQRIKIELALCKGKKLYDKRDSIKKREQDREMNRIKKNY